MATFTQNQLQNMCGRFAIIKSPGELEKKFKVDVNKEVYQPSLNLAPTQKSLVITSSKRNIAQNFTWGLIPNWANTDKNASKLINARSETLLEKPAFKNLVSQKTCVVLADGFYEWKTIGKQKVPYFINLQNDESFAFAGLFDVWQNNSGQFLETFTIITTTANNLMREVHQRMPVIFHEINEIDNWLNTQIAVNKKMALLKPLPEKLMKMQLADNTIFGKQNLGIQQELGF